MTALLAAFKNSPTTATDQASQVGFWNHYKIILLTYLQIIGCIYVRSRSMLAVLTILIATLKPQSNGPSIQYTGR